MRLGESPLGGGRCGLRHDDLIDVVGGRWCISPPIPPGASVSGLAPSFPHSRLILQHSRRASAHCGWVLDQDPYDLGRRVHIEETSLPNDINAWTQVSAPWDQL